MARGGKRVGAGRKKGAAAILAEKSRQYIAKRVEKEQKPIIDKAIEQAKEGDAKARDFLYERAHGKVAQSIDHTTKGEKLPTPILATVTEDAIPSDDRVT